MLLERCQTIKPNDFEQIDMGMYQCETATVVWEDKIDILITCWEEHAGYGYNEKAIIQCAKWTNKYLEWIEEHKEYIQKTVSDNTMFEQKYGFEMTEKILRQIRIEIDIQGETPQEISACMYVDAKPFFSGHSHCMEVVIQKEEDGTYQVDVIKDVQRLLLEIREVSKEQDESVYEWAKDNGIFYAFDEEGNMLAAVQQEFCLSTDNKLVSATENCEMKRFSGNKLQGSALYFIRADREIGKHCASSWEGIPMPFGFITKELTCKKNVFTITSSSGHEAVSGTFFVMQEALTMIEMLFCSGGVTE
ncbi:MAG: hypothetical protein K2G55_03895, partial [Lachnospiraceae bacterium]|nr:hypothetical protein [Lachnospiraceae bacterium]